MVNLFQGSLVVVEETRVLRVQNLGEYSATMNYQFRVSLREAVPARLFRVARHALPMERKERVSRQGRLYGTLVELLVGIGQVCGPRFCPKARFFSMHPFHSKHVNNTLPVILSLSRTRSPFGAVGTSHHFYGILARKYVSWDYALDALRNRAKLPWSMWRTFIRNLGGWRSGPTRLFLLTTDFFR